MSIRELRKLSESELIELAHKGKEPGAAYALMLKDKKAIVRIILRVVHDKELAGDVWNDSYLQLNTELQKGTYQENGSFKP